MGRKPKSETATVTRKPSDRSSAATWEVQKYNVVLELTEPMLGTKPLNTAVYSNWLAKKQTEAMTKEGLLTDEEIKEKISETITGIIEDPETEGLTGFLRDDKGAPYIEAYLIKGFLKNAAKVIKEHNGLKQMRSKITNHLFVVTPMVYVGNKKDELEVIERPLRASTPMGERTALARSESVPAGTQLSFEVHITNGVLSLNTLKDLFFYGKYAGLGQWRNSGKGSFNVVSITEA